ncbi:MAG: Na-translocating system protein MpsC family protein [Planctomycetota bacterium]
MRTRGEVEAAVCSGMSRFEQEYMGRWPNNIHSHLIRHAGRGDRSR